MRTQLRTGTTVNSENVQIYDDPPIYSDYQDNANPGRDNFMRPGWA